MPEFLANLSWLQWGAIVVLALLAWRNKDLLAPAVEWIKGRFGTSTLPKPTDSKPTAEQAFAAVNVLLAYFEETKSSSGVSAAREAGRRLFDKPEHAT